MRARPSTTPKGRKVDAKPVAEWDSYFGKAIKSKLETWAYSNVDRHSNVVEAPYANLLLGSDNVSRLAGRSFFMIAPNWNAMDDYSVDISRIGRETRRVPGTGC